MPSDIIKLRRLRIGEWALFAPKGHQISNIFKGNQILAEEWARAYCSTWGNWSVHLDGEDEYGQEKRVSDQDVRSSQE